VCVCVSQRFPTEPLYWVKLGPQSLLR